MHFKQHAVFPMGHSFIVVQPHEETEHFDGASTVYGRGKQGLAAPWNK